MKKSAVKTAKNPVTKKVCMDEYAKAGQMKTRTALKNTARMKKGGSKK